ncbi:hypothetical protein MUP00_12415, partial [Candidatus Bathyarchaeota archaeon]|nr:hypothetical protein [Candidatus Bathyarchaeota archaeon]
YSTTVLCTCGNGAGVHEQISDSLAALAALSPLSSLTIPVVPPYPPSPSTTIPYYPASRDCTSALRIRESASHGFTDA